MPILHMQRPLGRRLALSRDAQVTALPDTRFPETVRTARVQVVLSTLVNDADLTLLLGLTVWKGDVDLVTLQVAANVPHTRLRWRPLQPAEL